MAASEVDEDSADDRAVVDDDDDDVDDDEDDDSEGDDSIWAESPGVPTTRPHESNLLRFLIRFVVDA